MGLEDLETDFNFMKADSKLNGSMIDIAKVICFIGLLKNGNCQIN